MTMYSRMEDFILHEILEPLGDCSDQFDVEAIAEEIAEWHNEITDNNEVNLNKSGFRVKDSIDFWAVAEKHALD